jgi:UPF0716 protein FxsA
MALFLTFLVLPAVEIYLFIVVGGAIGGLTAVALTVLTALIGAFLVRMQGLQVMRRAQESMDRGEAPVAEAVDGVGLFVAGALLFVPGFLTDFVGALLLVPAVRRGIGAVLLARMVTVRAARRQRRGDGVIEGEFEIVDDEDDGPPTDPQRRLR